MDDLIKEKFNNLQKQLDEQELRIALLEKNTAILEKMDCRLDNVEKYSEIIDKKIDELQKEKQENQKEKGKKWDKLIDYLFYFIIAAILGYLAMKIGLK